MNREQFRALVEANRGKVPRRLPRQLPPLALELRYTKALQRIMAWVHERVQRDLLPVAKAASEQASRIATTDAATVDQVASEIDKLRRKFDRRYSRSKLSAIVEPYPLAISQHQARQLNRQLEAIVSVDVVGDAEPWLDTAIDEFVRENVALIKSIPSRYFDEIETTIRRESADGVRWEEIAKDVEERYDVSRSRAKLIARDQVGKFLGDLNRVRQTDLGISRFVWRTVRDNRVRDTHADLDGQEFVWGEAPFGGPGEEVLCRCYADPVIESALE